MNPGDRRRYHRLTIEVVTVCTAGSRVITSITSDIGEGGLFLYLREPPSPGEYVTLRLQLPVPHPSVELGARVVYTQDGLGMGLEFAPDAVQAKRSISVFLHALESEVRTAI